MKGTTRRLSLAAIIYSYGCNRGTTNDATSDATAPANGDAPSTGASTTVDAALVTAHPWALELECQRDSITFHPDGRLTVIDGETWRWSLNGDRLTLTSDRGSDSVFTVRRSGEAFVMTPTTNRGGNDLFPLPSWLSPALTAPPGLS